jgi:NAD(P)-dependent dehydrogenase (short-subunit alcohol dehydrogenase family)
MAGKVVLVTGATDGIGKETARQLSERGATVLVHGRNRERAAQAARDLRGSAPEGLVEPIAADLASLDAVRELAREVASRFDRLDILLNNAGVMTPRRMVSADGYELTFAVNHLAHFLLTCLLLDRLKASAPARVVTVSSQVHASGTIHFDDPQLEHGWSAYEAYAQSKLANVLFAYALARRLTGSGVTSNTLHPGVVGTKLLREGFGGGGGTDVTEGARTSVYLASDPAVAAVTGEYFVRRQPARSAHATYDEALQERLWSLSKDLTGAKGG